MERSPEAQAEQAMSLRRYAAERIVASAFVLWVALSLVFVLLFVVPADPAKQHAGKGAPEKLVAYVRADLHLDKPLYEQYGHFFGRLLHGDLGTSYYNRVSVRTIVGDAAPVTGSLVGWALFFALVIAVPLGLGWRRSPRRVGRPARVFVYLGIGVHPIWVGLTLAYFVGYRWAILPIHAYADFFNAPPGQPGGLVQWAYHLVLPSLTLALPVAAIYTRVVRALAGEVAQAVEKHAARRLAAIGLARLVIRDLSWLLGASIFVEVVFSLPGLGLTAVQALNNFDLPTVQGVIVFVIFLQVCVLLVTDLIGAAVTKDWRWS